MECPPSLTSTAIYYGTLRIMQTFAAQLGREPDAKQFAQLADETKAAFNREFFKLATQGYGSQTADAVALRFGLEPAGQGRAVAKALVCQVVDRHTGHAFVGIHGGRPLYTELCAHGAADVAIAAMKQPSWPSYAYALAHGFTTWPEQFEEIKPDEQISGRSFNHPMQSGFAAWFHESIGGIQPAAPGSKRIELDPRGFEQLAWANAEHDSPYGPIVSNWRSSHGEFEWRISIPPNTTALVSVPARAPSAVKEGGRSAADNGDLKYLRSEDGCVIYEAQPGNYEFQSQL